MTLIRIIYFLFAFCGTISQGLWIGPLNAEVILIVDIPLLMMFIVGKNTLRKDPKSKKVLLAMQLYLLWTFVGLLFAFNKHDAFLDVITNVRAFLIMLAVYRYLNSKKDLEFFLLGIGCGLLFQGLVGVYQWRIGYANLRFLGEMNFGWQSSGTFVHPNVYGLYLLLLTPLVYRLAFFIETKWKNIFLIIFLVGVTALFAAQSRACWLGFTGAMCIFGFYDLIRRRLLKTKMMKLWVIVGFLGIFGIIQYGYIITGRFADAEESMTAKRSSSRLSLAKDAVRIIGENLVWGVGPDNYSYFASENTAGLRVVHCTYLLIAAELGMPGIIFFLLMFFQV